MVIPDIYDRDVVHRLPVDTAVGERWWWLAGRFEHEAVTAVQLHGVLTMPVMLQWMRPAGDQFLNIRGATQIVESTAQLARRRMAQLPHHETLLLTGPADPFVPEPYDQELALKIYLPKW